MNFRMPGVILGAATTVVAGIAFAAPASATIVPPDGGSWDHIWTTQDASPAGGTVYIQEHGDIVDLCDTDADGYTPSAQITYTSSGIPYHYDLKASGGYGNCVLHSAADGGIYNLPENAEIEVTVYLANYEYTYTNHYVNDH